MTACLTLPLGPRTDWVQDEAPAPSATRFDAAANAQMERMLADFGRVYRERNALLKEVIEAHHDALLRLTMAAEYRDDDTAIHIVRIGYLAEALALILGADKAWATMLRKAAPMHDIGKIGTPDHVLKKRGRLDVAEREIMNQHPEIGASMLGRSRIPLFQMAAEVALNHHEKYDGSGYPYGRSGDGIPLSGRIVAVVDFFDALTMDRCYRKALPDDQVRVMVESERGRSFDPVVVDAFLAHWDRFTTLRDIVTQTAPGFSDLVQDTSLPSNPFSGVDQ